MSKQFLVASFWNWHNLNQVQNNDPVNKKKLIALEEKQFVAACYCSYGCTVSGYIVVSFSDKCALTGLFNQKQYFC